MKFTLIFVFFTFSVFYSLKAQSIENVNVRIVENNTYVTYDLVDVKENQQVDVKIFANVRGMKKPIFKVSGDVGKDIIPGNERTIIWKNNEELTAYNTDDITFTVTVTAKQFYRAAKR